jgi:hypothetical protein
MIEYIIANWAGMLEAVTSFVGACAVIATMTPNTKDNQIVDGLLKAINFFGANFGKAKNA